MAETISTAIALIAAFILGYGVRGEREAQAKRRLNRNVGAAPAARSYTDAFYDPNLIREDRRQR